MLEQRKKRSHALKEKEPCAAGNKRRQEQSDSSPGSSEMNGHEAKRNSV